MTRKITFERIGMGLLALSAGLWALTLILTLVGVSEWLWLLPGGAFALGLLTLVGKALYDRFADEENTKYGDVD